MTHTKNCKIQVLSIFLLVIGTTCLLAQETQNQKTYEEVEAEILEELNQFEKKKGKVISMRIVGRNWEATRQKVVTRYERQVNNRRVITREIEKRKNLAGVKITFRRINDQADYTVYRMRYENDTLVYFEKRAQGLTTILALGKYASINSSGWSSGAKMYIAPYGENLP